MTVIRNQVVMVVLMAVLAIKSTSALLLNNTQQLPTSSTVLALPTLPALPALPALPPLTLPTLPALPTLTLPTLTFPTLTFPKVTTAAPTVTTTTTTAPINRQCPVYTRLVPFTKTAFDGDWFVYEQSANLIETGWTCKRLSYNEVTNAFTYSFRHLGVPTTYVGSYVAPNPTKGAFAVTLQNMLALGADSMGIVNQFVVAGVATDFMIIRACTFFPAVPGLVSFNIEYVYVLTRTAVPTAAVQTAIATALTTVNINPAVLAPVLQTGC